MQICDPFGDTIVMVHSLEHLGSGIYALPFRTWERVASLLVVQSSMKKDALISLGLIRFYGQGYNSS